MNNSDFKQTSEKYKKEMMKLYGNGMSPKQNIPPQPVLQPTVELPQEPVQVQLPQESPHVKQMSPPPPQEVFSEPPQTTPPDFNIEDRFPPPVLPDFITGEENNYNSYGYLKVSVKTGNGGLPLAESLVTVSEIRDGKENIIKLMSTDSSGDTEILRLPAPSQSIGKTPQDYDKFAKYNVSAYSKGYFREISVDVPIFAGITSIQNFSLIPEPFDYNSGERTIVDRNPEPVI